MTAPVFPASLRLALMLIAGCLVTHSADADVRKRPKTTQEGTTETPDSTKETGHRAHEPSTVPRVPKPVRKGRHYMEDANDPVVPKPKPRPQN